MLAFTLQRCALLVLALCAAAAAGAAAAQHAALVGGGHGLSLADQQYQQAVDIRWVQACAAGRLQAHAWLGCGVPLRFGFVARGSTPPAPFTFP